MQSEAATQRDVLFDSDWRFFRDDSIPHSAAAPSPAPAVPAFAASAFEDSGWRSLDVPRDWSVQREWSARPTG